MKKIKILQTAKEESGSFLRDVEDSKRGNAARRRTPHRSHRTGADQDNRKNEGSEDPTGRNAARSTDGHTTTKRDRGTPLVAWKSKGQKTERQFAFVYRWTLPQKKRSKHNQESSGTGVRSLRRDDRGCARDGECDLSRRERERERALKKQSTRAEHNSRPAGRH